MIAAACARMSACACGILLSAWYFCPPFKPGSALSSHASHFCSNCCPGVNAFGATGPIKPGSPGPGALICGITGPIKPGCPGPGALPPNACAVMLFAKVCDAARPIASPVAHASAVFVLGFVQPVIRALIESSDGRCPPKNGIFDMRPVSCPILF